MKITNNTISAYHNLELKEQLHAIFFMVSALLAMVGFILGILFQVPFWMNIPHLIIVLLCLCLPAVLKKSISETTNIIMLLGSLFYMPFVFITNNGYAGAAPIYLVMIIVYYAFHFNGKKLLFLVTFLNAYYLVLIVSTYHIPSIIVPYPDDISHLIDICVAVASVSTVLVIVSYSAFSEYKRERKNVYELMGELKKQNEALEELSIRDQLTNVYSRKYFLDKLEEELEIARKDSFIFYVLMVDIDHFKKINDTYGHLFGDEVLRCVAKSLGANIRSFDIVARYGGEEFIILLTHSDGTNGKEIAERIRKSIEALTFRNESTVTASIGLSINCAGDTINDIIERADAELYKAKNSGRNRVSEWQSC